MRVHIQRVSKMDNAAPEWAIGDGARSEPGLLQQPARQRWFAARLWRRGVALDVEAQDAAAAERERVPARQLRRPGAAEEIDAGGLRGPSHSTT